MGLRTKNRITLGAKILLAIYIVMLIYVCFFSERYGRDIISDTYRYNLVPFKEIRRFLVYRENVGFIAFIENLFGNVIAFMPFGFFIPIISPRNRKFLNVLALTFLLSLTVETIQLMLKVGSFDVDDLLLNTLGGITGYAFFAAANYFRRKRFG